MTALVEAIRIDTFALLNSQNKIKQYYITKKGQKYGNPSKAQVFSFL